MQYDRTNNYVDTLRGACNQREYNMIMCVLRSSRLDTYSAIKKLTVSDFGIPSQASPGSLITFLSFFKK